MRVSVVGPIKEKDLLFHTEEATALVIDTDDGQPALIIKILPNGKGYIRLTKGEDANFDREAKQLGFVGV